MAKVTLAVPNTDVPDVLAALEQAWSKEASRINPDYSSLLPADRAAACLGAYLRKITRAYRHDAELKRRRQTETPIVVAEPDVT